MYKTALATTVICLFLGITLIIIGLTMISIDSLLYIYRVIMKIFRSDSDPHKGSGPKRPTPSPNGPSGPNKPDSWSISKGQDEANKRRGKIVDMHQDNSGEDNIDLDPSYAIGPEDRDHYRDIYNKISLEYKDWPMREVPGITKAEHELLYEAFKDSVKPDMSVQEYFESKHTILAKTLAARRAIDKEMKRNSL